MEPMVGLDAKFLYSETPSTHMHTLKVAVFDMSDARRWVLLRARSLDLFGPSTRPAPPVPSTGGAGPLGLGHPVWVEDPDFDLTTTRHPPPGRRAGR